MGLLLASFVSPIAAAVISLIVFFAFRSPRFRRPSGKALVRVSSAAAAICAALTLTYTIIEMAWYEAGTGRSAGNGPLSWILFTGPFSVAVGLVVALVAWLFVWPPNLWKSRLRPNKSLERTRDG
jgi:hypothetical protein